MFLFKHKLNGERHGVTYVTGRITCSVLGLKVWVCIFLFENGSERTLPISYCHVRVKRLMIFIELFLPSAAGPGLALRGPLAVWLQHQGDLRARPCTAVRTAQNLPDGQGSSTPQCARSFLLTK